MSTMARRLGLAAAVVIALAVLGGRPAAAEWFADVFTGVGLTQSHDFKLNDQGIGPGTYDDVSFDKALAFGGRFGRYFDSLPFLGFGVDYFHFTPYVGPQSVNLHGCFYPGGCGAGTGGIGTFEVTVNSVSLDLMLRLPLLKSTAAPQGRVQPYLAVGAPLFITTITPRNTKSFRNHDDDTDVSIGGKGAAGVAVQIYQNLMLFAEYRFTHVSPDVELHDASTNRVKLSTDLNTHSALIGLSARW
jgi:opacity protein-like surface antigen